MFKKRVATSLFCLFAAPAASLFSTHLMADTSQHSSYDCELGDDGTQMHCVKPGWYVHGSVGKVNGSSSVGDIKNPLSNAGFDITQVDLDDSRTGWKFNLGYAINQHWAVEGGYTDLDKVSTTIAAVVGVNQVDSFFQQAKTLHPTSAKGWTLSTVATWPLTDKVSVNGRVGLFNWQGDFDTLNLQDNIHVGSDRGDGTDIYYGLYGEFLMSKKSRLTLEWERYRFDDNHSDMFSIGFKYFFGAAKKHKMTRVKPVVKQDLMATKAVPAIMPAKVVAPALDSDGDGVSGQSDHCPDTRANVEVNSNGCELLQPITLNIQFDSAKSVIKDEFMSEISRVAKIIKQQGDVSILVEGHTDWKGKQVNNQPLSQARAEAVAALLKQKTGLSESNITVSGYGELKPVADNKTAAGRYQNRRVMVIISPNR